jgi:hypothetical protein
MPAGATFPFRQLLNWLMFAFAHLSAAPAALFMFLLLQPLRLA